MVIDTTKGPVLIDRGALVQAFSRIEGPCYVGPDTQIGPPSAPSVYIRCAEDHAVAAPWAEFAALVLTGSPPRVIQTSHSPFLSRPAELADMFDEIAGEFTD